MRISLIGAGNVGTQLGLAFHGAGHEIIQVYSRNPDRALLLANQISSQAISDLRSMDTSAELVILAVHDDAVSIVFDLIQARLPEALIVHTAGSLMVDVFKGHLRYGVIWPVQTLSTTGRIDMRTVPFAIAGNTTETTEALMKLTKTISDEVYHTTDEQRAFLHVAATFASNFSNHMYALSQQITDAHGIPFDILKPLIQETAKKIERMSPVEAQTGAAVRNDKGTILTHLVLLKDRPDLQEIYHLITQSIRTS